MENDVVVISESLEIMTFSSGVVGPLTEPFPLSSIFVIPSLISVMFEGETGNGAKDEEGEIEAGTKVWGIDSTVADTTFDLDRVSIEFDFTVADTKFDLDRADTRFGSDDWLRLWRSSNS
jgi:hypothetical protein